MRYDLVTKDALAGAPFSHAPGQPATIESPRLVRGDAALLEAEDEALHALHDPEEDSVMPLFPEDAQYDDPDYSPEQAAPPPRGNVRLRLAEVAQKRGVVLRTGKFQGQPNLSAIQRGTGLAYATVFKMLRKPEDLTGVSFEALARLCEYLHCQPGDLLTWDPKADAPQTNISDYFKRQTGGPVQ